MGRGMVVRLAVVVPATDDPPALDRCLAAIAGSDDAPDELIVVRAARHAGPAAARNQGAGRAVSEIIVFVDADVALHRDALGLIRRAFRLDCGLAAVFGTYDDSPD